MNVVLNDLKNLQQVDDQLKACREAEAEASAKLAAAAARLKSFEDKLAAVKQELAQMKSRHQELEKEVGELSVKRENNQKRQMSVKNNTEFNALAKEAEFLSTRINGLEDETLELLDRIEKMEVEKADLEILVSEEAALYGATASEIESAGQAGREAKTHLTAQRRQLVEALPPNQLRQYDEIAKVRAGKAVAPAINGLCTACSLGFPPQIFNELQRNEKIITCPNCGRIMFWRDHPDFQPDAES